MFRHFLFLLAAFVLASPALAQEESAQTRYADAKGAFDKGDFQGARKMAEKMLAQGQLSREAFQLLGNAHYRLGHLGEASLFFRRANLFPPVEPEVRQNLAHIRDRTGHVSFPRSAFREQYAGFVGRTQWFITAVCAAWVAIGSFVLAIFLRRRSPLRVGLAFVRVLAVIVAVLAGLGLYWRPSFERIEKVAIVTVPDTKAYTAATVTAGTVSSLPPGSEIRRLEDRGIWSYVEIPGEDQNRRGWVQNAAFEPLWPYQRGYLE